MNHKKYPIGQFVVDEDGETGIIVDRKDYSVSPHYTIKWFYRTNHTFSTSFIESYIARYMALERL